MKKQIFYLISKYVFAFFLITPISVLGADLFKPDINWSLQQLKKKKINSSFLKILKKNYDKKSFTSVIRLNTLGFLSPPNHMSLVSDEAVMKSLDFLNQNKTSFDIALKEYTVPPEIITSLLWVETRHGKITGTFHVPSVYLHLLQLSRQKNQNYLFKIARKSTSSHGISSKDLRKKIKERSIWRAKWALEELIALEKMHHAKQKDLKNLKGSFAGAFGLPQFIPSSYRAFACSSADRPPNLFTHEDSIQSVARYLMVHGWDNLNTEHQINSLMKYNNSRDYAESIIELAKKIRKLIKEKKLRAVAADKDTLSS